MRSFTEPWIQAFATSGNHYKDTPDPQVTMRDFRPSSDMDGHTFADQRMKRLVELGGFHPGE